jgi:hypothetical protein
MLTAALALFLTQAPAPHMSPEDPWLCPGFQDERVWRSDSKVVPLGFSRNGRFAVARRLAEADLMSRMFYTRELKVVDLRTDRERRRVYDVNGPAKAVDELLVAEDVVQTCPPLDSPAQQVTVRSTLQRTPDAYKRRTEVLLRTGLGVKRLVREDSGQSELRYAGSVTSPYGPRVALLFVELGQAASHSPRDDVLGVYVVGASLKEGFARDPQLELSFLAATFDRARLSAGPAELHPVGFCAKRCFAYVTTAPGADATVPRARRLVVADLADGAELAAAPLVAATSAYEALRGTPAALELLGAHGVLPTTPQLLAASGFSTPSGDFALEVLGDAVWLQRKSGPAGKQQVGTAKGEDLAIAGVLLHPSEPRAAVVLGRGPATQRQLAVLGASLGAPPSSPPPKAQEKLSAVGFTKDGSLFVAITAPPDSANGSVVAWDVATGRPTPQPAASASFGEDGKASVPPAVKQLAEDPGREGYKSGTRTSTTVQFEGMPIAVDLVAVPTGAGAKVQRAHVALSRSTCRQSVPLPEAGTDFNLVSVLTSSTSSAIAVVVKGTHGDVRRFQVATASLAKGPLGGAECASKPARASGELEPACVARLRELKGGYDIVGQNTWSLSISGERELTVLIGSSAENVGGSDYQVAGCTLSGGRLTLELDQSGRRSLHTLTGQPGGVLKLSGGDALGICRTGTCTLRPASGR